MGAQKYNLTRVRWPALPSATHDVSVYAEYMRHCIVDTAVSASVSTCMLAMASTEAQQPQITIIAP